MATLVELSGDHHIRCLVLIQLAPGTMDMVVLDLLSKTAYIGTNEDGLPLPAVRQGMSATMSLGHLSLHRQ
jgi:hypothetical protein